MCEKQNVRGRNVGEDRETAAETQTQLGTKEKKLRKAKLQRPETNAEGCG